MSVLFFRSKYFSMACFDHRSCDRAVESASPDGQGCVEGQGIVAAAIPTNDSGYADYPFFISFSLDVNFLHVEVLDDRAAVLQDQLSGPLEEHIVEL
ncbi:MAG: hypothetical protein CXX71_03905 [Methanobacteriota archaeon]|nr:MAG: hypothetical protein CXX71_03905 [Euryarchaeota archaeon]